MPTPETFLPPAADRYGRSIPRHNNADRSPTSVDRLHYQAPERTVTAKQLAELVGYNSYSSPMSSTVRLARLVGEQLGLHPRAGATRHSVTFGQAAGRMALDHASSSRTGSRIAWVG